MKNILSRSKLALNEILTGGKDEVQVHSLIKKVKENKEAVLRELVSITSKINEHESSVQNNI